MASKESSGINRFESVDGFSFSSTEMPNQCETLMREEKERSFLRQLKSLHCARYIYFQKAMFLSREPNEDTYKEYAAKNHYKYCPVEPMDLGDSKHYSFDELNEMTDSFSDENVVGAAPFGKLFKGCIREGENGPVQNVLVKTWLFFPCGCPTVDNHPTRFFEEIDMLRKPEFRSDPRVMKLVGFHCDRVLAVVYEYVPPNFLSDIITSDYFGWKQRMDLAIEIGEFMKEFHDGGLVHGGIDSEWILIDENYVPKCFCFKLKSYCEDHPEGYYAHLGIRYGSCAPVFFPGPAWTMEHGIGAYGVLLLELISKETLLFENWLERFNSYEEKSFVHESFKEICDHIGSEITSCALKCLGFTVVCRPAIGDVLEELKKLVDSSRLPKYPRMLACL